MRRTKGGWDVTGDSHCMSESFCSSSLFSSDEQLSEQRSWESLLMKHHKEAYGIEKNKYYEVRNETTSSPVQENDEENIKSSSSLYKHLKKHIPRDGDMSPSPSVHLRSPMIKGRRLVSRIIDSYDEQKLQSENKLQLSATTPQKESENESAESGWCDVSESRNDKLYDWKKSPLHDIALNKEDDNLVADIDDLLKKLEQHRSEEAMKTSHLRTHYPKALQLLCHLHRDLHCPSNLHKAFYLAHSHPSAFNFASLLSRILTLSNSRMILLDLLRASGGSPSPRVVARIFKQQKEQGISKKNNNEEPLSRIDFSGQSPDQIRERARKTTIAIAESTASNIRLLARDLSPLPRFDKTEGAPQLNAPERSSRLRRYSRKSSLMKSISDVEKELDSVPNQIQDLNHSILKPSQLVATDLSDQLHVVVENSDDSDSSCENSIGSTTEYTESKETPVAISKLLQVLCDEWLSSLPWTVTQFKYGHKVMNKS